MAGSVSRNSVIRRYSAKARPSMLTMPSRPGCESMGSPAARPVTMAAATTTIVGRSFSARPAMMMTIPDSRIHSGISRS